MRSSTQHCHGTGCHGLQHGAPLEGLDWLSSETADFAAVLLAASFFGLTRSHFSLSGALVVPSLND